MSLIGDDYMNEKNFNGESIIEDKLNHLDNLFIFDLEEKYLLKYHETLLSKGYNVITLDFNDLNKCEGWNPLEYPYELYKNGMEEKAINHLKKLAKIIFRNGGETNEARLKLLFDYFTGVVLYLFEEDQFDKINLVNVYNFFDLKSIADVKRMFENRGVAAKSYYFASKVFLAPEAVQKDVLVVSKFQLQSFVTREKLNVLLSKTSFNYEDCLTKLTAILLVGKEESNYINLVCTMFIEQFFQFLVDNNAVGKYSFVLDDIEKIDTDINFDDMAN